MRSIMFLICGIPAAFATMLVFVAPGTICAQTPSKSPQAAAVATQTQRATIDDTPFATSIAPAHSGLLGAIPDSLDAAVYNPAGIGGVYNRGAKSIRHFQFPYLAAQMNDDSRPLLNSSTLAGSAGAPQLGAAISEAAAGRPQYARQSIAPNFGIGRLLLVPFYDQQIAAAALNKAATDVELLHQTRTGFGIGTSLMEPSENLYVGTFSTFSNVVRGEGTYASDDPVVTDAIDNSIYSANQSRYTLIDHNIGALLRFNRTASPSMAITLRHLGGTKHAAGEGVGFTDQQQLGVSLNVSPTLGRYLLFNTGAGINDLEYDDLALSRKWRAYSEIHVGEHSEESWLAVRAGASYLGASYGGHLNIGIIGLQYANFPVDISATREAIVERRQSASVFVDLAR